MSIHIHKPNHANELLSKLIKEAGHVHDWLVGPAMTEHDRIEKEILANEGWVRAFRGPR